MLTIEDSEVVISTIAQDIAAARERYKQVLASERLKQDSFAPRFHLHQLATLFPEREAYREIYEWFSDEIRALYGLDPL